MTLQFTIAEDGTSYNARVVNDGVHIPSLSAFVEAIVNELVFAPPTGGEVTITNTFVFQPG
jgi:hypothetical protein